MRSLSNGVSLQSHQPFFVNVLDSLIVAAYVYWPAARRLFRGDYNGDGLLSENGGGRVFAKEHAFDPVHVQGDPSFSAGLLEVDLRYNLRADREF